jgi:hypothetical protein
MIVTPLAYAHADSWFSKPDAQEQAIGDAINQGLSVTGTKVDCVSRVTMNLLSITNFDRGIGQVRGLGKPGTGKVWLLQEDCDAMSDFALHPPRSAQEVSWVPDDQKTALQVAAHEAAHAQLDEPSESRAECDSFQLVGGIAVALGMVATAVPTLRQDTIDILVSDHAIDDRLSAKLYRFDLGSCRDGGPGDLHLDVAGSFPAKP